MYPWLASSFASQSFQFPSMPSPFDHPPPSFALPCPQIAQQHAVKLSQVEGPVTHWCIFQAIGWPSFSAAYSSMSCDRRLKRAPCGWAPRDCSSCCACAYVCWLLQQMSCTTIRFGVNAATRGSVQPHVHMCAGCCPCTNTTVGQCTNTTVGQCRHMCTCVLAVAAYVLHHRRISVG